MASLTAMIAAVALSACGSASHPSVLAVALSRTGPQTIFEAESQLHANPGATLSLLRKLGVDRVRVFISWATLAPDPTSRVRPKFDAADPAPYGVGAWGIYDEIVRDAVARHIGLDFTVGGPAPLWAAGRDVPAGTAPGYFGVWKPSATAFGQFVRAIGLRYSGHYKPPGSSAPLPHVGFWSIWNEPNYGPDLAPQATDQSTVELSPAMYRGLLDAAWSALQATGHAHDTILIGETAPRGITTGANPIGNFSGMVPLRFVRALYCVDQTLHPLRGNAAALRGCPTTAAGSAAFPRQHPALFQASGFADHPYPQGAVPPNVATVDEPDYADLAALPNLERTLVSAYAVYGYHRQVPIYNTEFGYQTNPPETIARAINPTLAAAYMNQAEYLGWRDPWLVSWDQYLLTDPPGGNFATGLETDTGQPKAMYWAFRMPIYLPVTTAAHGHSVDVWGCARPAHYVLIGPHKPQIVSIQFAPASGGGFHVLKRLQLTDPYGYFDVPVTFPSSGAVRTEWTYPGGERIHSRIVNVTIR